MSLVLLLVIETWKMTIFVAHFILVILGRAVKSLYVSWVTTLIAPIFILVHYLIIKSFFTWLVAWFSGVLCCNCLCLLIGLFFLLYLVVWIPFSGAAGYWTGSLATCLIWYTVALELCNVFISSLTLLVGNLSKSTLPSIMVLDTKPSSHEKNQKISQCNIFAVSGGYFVRLICAWTALYHLLILLLPWKKLVKRLNWAWTSFDCSLQKSLNLSQIVSRFISSSDNPHETYWSLPKLPDQAITFYIAGIQGEMQAHILGYSHIWASIWEIYGGVHHLLSSPFLDPLYMAYMSLDKLVGALKDLMDLEIPLVLALTLHESFFHLHQHLLPSYRWMDL